MPPSTIEDEKHSIADEVTFVSERPDSRLSRLLDYIGVGLFLLLLVLGTLQVFFRFIASPYFGYSIAWTGEAARFVLIYTTMFGSLIAARDNDHLRIEVITDRVPGRLQKGFGFVVHVATLLSLAFAAYGSYLGTLANLNVSPGAVPYISTGHVYAALVVGFVGMAAYELRWLVADLGFGNGPKEDIDE